MLTSLEQVLVLQPRRDEDEGEDDADPEDVLRVPARVLDAEDLRLLRRRRVGPRRRGRGRRGRRGGPRDRVVVVEVAVLVCKGKWRNAPCVNG